MFNFLKKFFTKKEIETIKLELKELKSFFDEKHKGVEKELNSKIDEIRGKIAEEITKTRNNLEVLKKAELRNENIPLKAKQFMEGNREAYIRIVNNLVDSINIEDDFASILKFCDDFNERLAHFTKSTTKAYQVLQEFFANESREIALNIKGLDSSIKKLKQAIKDKNLDRIKYIQDEISSIDNKKIKKHETKKNLEDQEKKKEHHLTLKKELEESHKKTKSSKEHDELLTLNEMRKKALNELNELKSRVFHDFSVINSALKKYARITVKDPIMLKKYLETPVLTLINDAELKILEFLDGAKKSILNEEIELKDKKKSKTLDNIDKLNKEFLTAFKHNYKKIEQKIKSFEEKIQKNTSKETLEEIEKKVDEVNIILEKLERNISYLKEEIEKIDFEKIKRKLEKEIKEVFDEIVSID